MNMKQMPPEIIAEFSGKLLQLAIRLLMMTSKMKYQIHERMLNRTVIVPLNGEKHVVSSGK